MQKDEKEEGVKAEQLPDIISHLPQSFFDFLATRNISLQYFKHLPSRYIRFKPSLPNISPKQLAEDLKIPESEVVRIDDFYQLPATVNIHQSSFYNEGVMYGMDISSGWVVKALGLEDDHHHLELCCAPGNKLMYARELFKGGSLTGVDISQNRINVAKSLFKKYGHDIRLFCEDATAFSQLAETGEKYDRVLVDAECTHQGSVKHLKKFLSTIAKDHQKNPKPNLNKKQKQQFKKNNSNTYMTEQFQKNNWTVEDFEQRFLDKKKLGNLKELQSKLLENGYRMLKDGGYIVYSTCSFDEGQNEVIVSEFMGNHPEATLVFPFKEGVEIPYVNGSLGGTVRFNPVDSNTGGMFIAKLHKPFKEQTKDQKQQQKK